MTVLVLGGTGMLGHKVWQVLHTRLDTYVTVRGSWSDVEHTGVFEARRTLCGVSADDTGTVAAALEAVRPSVVVNCVGVVKQKAGVCDPARFVAVNSLFPHLVARLVGANGGRLVQISTDCVFSGRRGGYGEADVPDADDLYGRSKLLGEVDYGGGLTLRTSIVGRQLSGAHGLVEWFLGNHGGSVRGYTRAVFSGVTTGVLATVIADLIERGEHLSGTWHVPGPRIDKCRLLGLLAEAYRLPIDVVPDDTVVCDRSLDGRRFADRTGFVSPTWAEMVAEMARDATDYAAIRRGSGMRAADGGPP